MRASYLYGPLTFFGLAVAAIACLIDQASKLYLLFVFDLAANPVHLGPFFDFVLTRNTGTHPTTARRSTASEGKATDRSSADEDRRRRGGPSRPFRIRT